MGQNITNNKNFHMLVPYQQGLSERIKNTCKKYGVQVHFKGGQTIKGLLMVPKDKDPITTKVGSSTDTNVVKMGVEKNTLESLQEPLWRVQRTPEVPLSYP